MTRTRKTQRDVLILVLDDTVLQLAAGGDGDVQDSSDGDVDELGRKTVRPHDL